MKKNEHVYTCEIRRGITATLRINDDELGTIEKGMNQFRIEWTGWRKLRAEDIPKYREWIISVMQATADRLNQRCAWGLMPHGSFKGEFLVFAPNEPFHSEPWLK